MREHTEKIRPPRALWVPFELGRPFGPPDQPEFQLDVLRALLRLFEAGAGPVLADYPHDALASGRDEEEWSCPLPLPPLESSGSNAQRLAQALQAELGFLVPWYAESVRRRGRTAFGLSGLDVERWPEMLAFVAAWAAGEYNEPPEGASESLPVALRSVVDDLKTLYLEAAAEQPGAPPPTGMDLNRWLYHQTRFGEALYQIRDRLAAEAAGDPQARPVALIPNAFRQRPGS